MSNTEETSVEVEVIAEETTEVIILDEPTTVESSVQQPTKENKRKPKAKTTDASSRQRELKPIGHSGKLSYYNS